MLQHERMVVDEWHNNGSQELITVSLCIQKAINKMPLFLLCIIYACPCYNSTATMGPLNLLCWHEQIAHPDDSTHAVCHLPWTVKTGIHPWTECLSNMPETIEWEHFPTQVSYDNDLPSGPDPNEDDEHAEEFPWDRFCINSLAI